MEDLFGARLQDLRQDPPRHQARLAAADAGHLDGLVLVHHRRERAAALALHLLRVGDRRAQPDGDVAGEVIAADGDDAGVPQVPRSKIARSAVPPPMSTSATPSSFSSGVSTASAAASCSITVSTTCTPARLTHATMFCVDDTAPVTTCTLTSSRGAGHPDRRADAVLLVDDEVLRQHVQDLAAGRQRHRLGGVDRPPHVVAGDLAILAGHRDHAAAVEPLDVRTRQREVHRVDLDAGHQLGFLDRLLDRIHRGLEIDDDAALDAARLGDADADDVEAAVVEAFADDAGHRRRADVEPDEYRSLRAT